MNNLETLKAQITEVESKIENVESEITSKQSNIDNFEYECSDSEYDEMIDECEEVVTIFGMSYNPSRVLKELDPIAYNCGKSDYESNYDLDNCEEYTDMVEQLESLNEQLEDLESELEELQEELSDLTDELDNLESESNIVITYKENGNESFMYFHADNEEHAIEQFNEFFKEYDGVIELVHCGYMVG